MRFLTKEQKRRQIIDAAKISNPWKNRFAFLPTRIGDVIVWLEFYQSRINISESHWYDTITEEIRTIDE